MNYRLKRIRKGKPLKETKDTDAIARYLLTETTAHDLEITARGLEDAFLSLTGGDDAEGALR